MGSAARTRIRPKVRVPQSCIDTSVVNVRGSVTAPMEGNSVVPASPSLRPSAERKRALRPTFDGPSEDGPFRVVAQIENLRDRVHFWRVLTRDTPSCFPRVGHPGDAGYTLPRTSPLAEEILRPTAMSLVLVSGRVTTRASGVWSKV